MSKYDKRSTGTTYRIQTIRKQSISSCMHALTSKCCSQTVTVQMAAIHNFYYVLNDDGGPTTLG